LDEEDLERLQNCGSEETFQSSLKPKNLKKIKSGLRSPSQQNPIKKWKVGFGVLKRNHFQIFEEEILCKNGEVCIII